MKLTSILTLLLILSSCNGKKNYPNSSNSIENDIIKLRYLKEVEWPKAYREQDTALLDRILGDDFQMIDGGGNWSNKKSELYRIKNNEWKVDSFFFEIKRLEILENGTAIICGTGHIIRDSIVANYQSSNFLIKRNGQWRAFASHVSGYNKVSNKNRANSSLLTPIRQ